MLIKNVMNIE